MSQAFVRSGHQAIVVTGKVEGMKDESSEGGVRVLRKYEQSEIGSPSVTRMVLSIAQKESVDIIEGADHLGECAELLGMSNRPPIIIKLHSSNAVDVLVESQILYPWQRIMVQASLFRCRMQRRRERKSITDADIAVAPSQRLCDEIVKQGLRNKVEFLPNPQVMPPRHAAEAREMPEILFVGRLDIGKGIQYLPKIMQAVIERCPDAVLSIAGSDSYARGLGSLKEWLSRKLGYCMSNVKFLGHLLPEDMDAVYRRCRVVIVPSRWDNFPGSVLEAMSYRKAVVASPNGGMPEMLENTGCVIADPASMMFVDGICNFLEDSEARRLAGENAYLRASKEYSPEKIVRDYVSIFKRYK